MEESEIVADRREIVNWKGDSSMKGHLWRR